MVDVSTLAIEVKSDGVATASNRLNQLAKDGGTAETATGKVTSAFSNLTGYIQAATAALASFQLAQYIKDATMFAANVEQANRALSVIANTMGMTSEKALRYRDALRDINITTNSATNATAQFIKAGFPLEALNKLGTAAQGAAISYQMMTGESISSSQALDKMIRSLVTGNVTELHTLGINVMMRDSLRNNKEATGEATMSVDSHARKLLMLGDVLKQTEPLMNLYAASTDLAAKQISSSKRPIEEMKLALGNLFLPELTVMATAFYKTVSGGMKWVKAHNDELKALTESIKVLSSSLVVAGEAMLGYLAVFKGPSLVSALVSWVAAFHAGQVANAEFSSQLAAGNVVQLNSVQATAMKTVAQAELATATAALTIEEVNRAVSAQAGLVAEKESTVAKLQNALANDKLITSQLLVAETESAQAVARTAAINAHLGLIAKESAALEAKGALSKSEAAFSNELRDAEFKSRSKLIIATQEQAVAEANLGRAHLAAIGSADARVAVTTQLAEVSGAASVATNQMTAAVIANEKAQMASIATTEAAAAAATKARWAWLSLANALNILFAAFIGWEIGKFLNKFEVVRQAGVYMVHGLIKAWDYASEAYERFTATVNPFGDEEKQQAQLASITAKYAAIKLTRDGALSGSLADTVKPDGTPKASAPYKDNAAAIAEGIRKEQERLAEEARRKAEGADKTVTDFNKLKAADDGRRALNESFWAWQDAGYKAAAKGAVDALQWQNEQGIISARMFINQKEQLEKGVVDREIERNNNRIKEMQNSATIKGGGGNDAYSDQRIKFEAAQKQLNEALTKGIELTAQSNGLSDAAAIAREKDISATQAKTQALYDEIDAMRAVNDASAAAQVGTNASGGFDTITDQIANQMAIQKQAHEARMKAINDERGAVERATMEGTLNGQQYYAKMVELDRKAADEKKKNSQTTGKIADDSYKSSLTAAAQYTGYASQAFTMLAETQDQSSKSGFESAKAYSIAAAVMNTAAGIMSAFASLPWPAAPIAAALVAATGVVQIAKISSTSFGGGSGSVSAPAGSFSAGEGGGASGGFGAAPMTSVQDSSVQNSDALLAGVDRNTVVIGRLSKTIEELNGLFKSGGAGNGLAVNAPGRLTQLTSESSAHMAYIKNILTAGGDFLGWNAGSTIKALGNVLFGAGKWTTTGAGMSVNMSGGQAAVQNYTEERKKGGLFTGNRTRTTYSDNAEASAYLTDLMTPFIVDLGQMADTLGLKFDAANYKVKTANLNLAGKTTEEISTILSDLMASTLSGMTLTIDELKPLIGTLDDAYTRIKQINDAWVTANDQLQLVGIAPLARGAQNAIDAETAQNSLYGGIDGFKAAMSDYRDVMYTQTERDAQDAASAQRTVNTGWAQIMATTAGAGLALPKTRAEFNALRATIDPNSPLFAALTNLGTAFATMTTAAEDAAKTLQITFLDTAISAANALKDIMGGDLSTLSPEAKYKAQQQAFADAQTAGRTAELPELGKALLTASRAYNGSSAGYTADYATVTAALADVAAMTQSPSLVAAEKQIQLLTDIRQALDDANTIKLAGLTSQLAPNAIFPTSPMAVSAIAADGSADTYKAANKAMEDKLDEVVAQLAKAVARLDSIDTKARLVAVAA